MSDTNPYKTYAEETILNASPMGLIIALYEGAIESSATARRCLASGDIPARTKAINKTINIVAELQRCLNDEKGGEISANLRRLYTYIQGRVLEAHTKKVAPPLEEAEKLLSIMLEGWRSADNKFDPSATITAAFNDIAQQPPIDYGYGDSGGTYGSYMPESVESYAPSAYSF